MKLRALKGRKSILIAVAIVGVIAIIGVIVWNSFFAPPTAKDYQRAGEHAKTLKSTTTQTEQVTAKYVETVVASLRIDPSGAGLKNEAASAKRDHEKALERYRKSLNDLRSSPAGRDEDVKQAIDRVVKQSEVFETGIVDMTDMYPTFYKTYISCDDARRFTAGPDAAKNFKDFDAQSQDCINDLKKLSDTSKVNTIAEYAEKRAKVVSEQRSAYESLTKKDANVELVNKRLKELSIQLIMLDPQALVQYERARAIDTTELDKLIKLLDDKAKS